MKKQHQAYNPVPAGVENLANLLDSKFTIPGTRFKFGIDPLISLIQAV